MDFVNLFIINKLSSKNDSEMLAVQNRRHRVREGDNSFCTPSLTRLVCCPHPDPPPRGRG